MPKTNTDTFYINTWRVLCADTKTQPRQTANQLLELDTKPPRQILKDTPRSLVKVYEFQNTLVVSKTPREKDRRKWIRLTTLWRKAEAFSTFHNTLVLARTGINVAKPVMAFEKRRFGMVVESRIFYEFAKGSPCTPEDWPDVVKTLLSIHKTNRVHADANIENFIRTQSGITVLDTHTKPALFGELSRKYDFVLLVKSCPGLKSCLPFKTTNVFFVAALCVNRLIRFWRQLKRGVRNLKNPNRSS